LPRKPQPRIASSIIISTPRVAQVIANCMALHVEEA